MLLLGFVGILVGDSLREIPQFVRRGHFAGRSGNVVVLPKEQSVTPSLLLLDQQRQHFIHEDSVEDVNLANLISHLFQSAPPSNEKDFMSIDRKNFPVISLFSAPAANVFVAIEDVSKSDLEKYPTLSMLQNRKQLDIVPTYRARDTLSTLETFLSGVTPSQHGIVGRSWLSPSGTEAFAFRDSGSSSRADSLFDVLALTSPSSLIVSMSSDYQYASAIGVRAQAMRNSPNVLSYFWNSKHQNFDSISGPRAEHSIQASRADILQSLKEKEMFNDIDGVMVAYDAKNMQAFVSARSTKVHTVPFDLNSEEDFRLFVEVFFVQMFRQVMKQDNFQSLIHDPTSDSYAFAFDGVSKIKNKYGVDSPQFSAALYLTDSAVKSLVGEISSAYHGKISSQIACIAPIPTFELPDEVTQQLDDALPSGLSNFLPDIYMGNELTLNEEKSLVIQMNTLLENLWVYCLLVWPSRTPLSRHLFVWSKRRW